MSNPQKNIIEVQGKAVAVLNQNEQDYVSLTDRVQHFEGGSALKSFPNFASHPPPPSGFCWMPTASGLTAVNPALNFT